MKIRFALILGAAVTFQALSQTPLPIPELIDSRAQDLSVSLEMREGQMEFFPGVSSSTYGYNGDFLGPTIRLYEGDTVRMNYTNSLPETTTLHQHGLHVPGHLDGGPQSAIEPGQTRTFEIPVRQRASTSWYHPHLMGKTAEHVFKGLAGMILVEDEESQSLALPKDYGVNDIPLVVQDRLFVNNVMTYRIFEMDEGYRGNTILVNGAVDPYLEVPQGLVRLRLLNGSNARFYNFRFSDNRNFHLIATDGGFINQPERMKNLVLAPGERAEILVEFSGRQNVDLITIPTMNWDNSDPLRYTQRGVRQIKILEIRVDSSRTSQAVLPDSFSGVAPYRSADALRTRNFVLNMGDEGGFGGDGDFGGNGFGDGDGGFEDGGFGDGDGFGGFNAMPMMNNGMSGMPGMMNTMGINGRPMDMNYINERVPLGELELWRVRGAEMAHPFHVHGTSFQVVSVNRRQIPENQRQWKDTVIIPENTVVSFLVRFDFEATEQFPYMYHCHILEHEEMGMMGQFTVQ